MEYLPTKLGDFGQGQMLVSIFQHHGSHMGWIDPLFDWIHPKVGLYKVRPPPVVCVSLQISMKTSSLYPPNQPKRKASERCVNLAVKI